LDWDRERTYNQVNYHYSFYPSKKFTQNEAETIKAELSKFQTCKVNFLEISDGFKAKPEGLNTVNMLKVTK